MTPTAGILAHLRRASRDPLWWVVGGLVLLYLALVVIRPQGIFWSLDEGGKFLYLQNVLRTHDPRAALDYPGRAIDPQLRFVPLYFWVRQGDQVYSWWAVGFSLLTLPFYLALGWLGLYALPILSGAVCAGLAGVLVRQTLASVEGLAAPGWLAPAAALITGLATPVAFYSTTFWEHTPSVACFLASIACVLQGLRTRRAGWLVLAGLFASATTFLRTDSVLLVAGLLAALLLWRWSSALVMGASFGAGSIPWMLLNWYWMGSPFSRYFSNITDGPIFAGVREAGLAYVAYVLFNAPRVMAFELSPILLILGTVATGVAILAVAVPAGRWVSLLACVGLAAISAYVLVQPYGYRSVHGFLLVAPQVVFAIWLYRSRPRGLPAFLALVVLAVSLAYGSAYLARGWLAAGGLQWGPRYLLALYPLTVVAALVGLAIHWSTFGRLFRAAVAATFIVGVVVGVGYEARGAYSLYETVQSFAQARRSIDALPAGPLVTRCTWLDMVIPEVYWSRAIFAVNGQADFEAWSVEARQAGVHSGYMIDMDACQNVGLDEVARLTAANPSGLTSQRFDLP